MTGADDGVVVVVPLFGGGFGDGRRGAEDSSTMPAVGPVEMNSRSYELHGITVRMDEVDGGLADAGGRARGRTRIRGGPRRSSRSSLNQRQAIGSDGRTCLVRPITSDHDADQLDSSLQSRTAARPEERQSSRLHRDSLPACPSGTRADLVESRDASRRTRVLLRNIVAFVGP